MLSDSGDAVICDSIACRAVASAQRSGKTVAGFGASFRWMAPELVDQDLPDSEAPELPTKSSDVWSFGMTIYVRCDHALPLESIS